MANYTDEIILIGVFLLIFLCLGDPDLLDGLIKAANKP